MQQFDDEDPVESTVMQELGFEDPVDAPVSPGASAEQLKPLNAREANRIYGQFGGTRCHNGRVDLPVRVAGTGAIVCHVDLLPQFRTLVENLFADGPGLIQTIIGYEQRLRRHIPARYGDMRICPSSWGLTLTINRTWNPEGRANLDRPVGEPEELTRAGRPGFSLFSSHPLVEIAEACGFQWLGRKTYADGSANNYPDPAMFAWIRSWH